jgi:zinc-ribbon family
MIGLIIFGRKSVTGSKGRGQFPCPTCQSIQSYDHKRVRRFFTLYFIPLIPLGTIGEYIECDRCKGTFKPTVLQLAGGPPQR